MSFWYQSTARQWRDLNDLYAYIALLCNESDDDDSDTSSNSSMSSITFDDNDADDDDTLMVDAYDNDALMVDANDDDSASTADMIEDALAMVHRLHEEMWQPIENPNVVWGRRLKIDDLSDAECREHLCFPKNHLADLKNHLWPPIHPHLGDEPTLAGKGCSNRNKVHSCV
jgi:hypothetical protein